MGCTTEQALAALRDPGEIRARCAEILAAGEAGELEHFRIVPQQLPSAAEAVVAVTRERYPDLVVPAHSRWRHLDAGGVDRWAPIASRLTGRGPEAVARAGVDLAVVSVLLDAGAGDAWRYRDATGAGWARSEGLAVASIEAFAAGAFSSDPRDPYRVDADGLGAIDARQVGRWFQAGPDNPLVGIEGRVALLRGLGEALRAHPRWFGETPPRPGGLVDDLGQSGTVRARDILGRLLDGLSTIWPGRIALAGHPLGDVWRHRAIVRDDPTDGLVPFHKLSQWLTYSLLEPFGWAGIEVAGTGELTGLAEYRNGGLLCDHGVLVPRDGTASTRTHLAGDPLVVEWRALTVALLDRLAPLVRERLGVDEGRLPLASVLEGGTWAAGRHIAAAMRAGGGPPLRIESDGTVF